MTNENKPKHTPGPWELGKYEGHFHIIAEDGGNTWHIADIFDNPNINAKANAALIAAAPEMAEKIERLEKERAVMLDALKGVVEQADAQYRAGDNVYTIWRGMIDDFRAIIAKAEGGKI